MGNERANDLVDVLANYGFSLANQKDDLTYLCHNGGSTIDLVFLAGLMGTVKTDRLASVSAIRKHIPVSISCTLKHSPPQLNIRKKIPRKIYPELLDGGKITAIADVLKNGELDAAYDGLCSLILDAVVVLRPEDTWQTSSIIERDSECRKLRHEILRLHHQIPQRPWLFGKLASVKRAFVNKVKEVRTQKLVSEENRRIEAAERFPWKLNPRRNGSFNCPITGDAWKNHFHVLFNPETGVEVRIDENWFNESRDTLEFLNADFTEEELSNTLFSSADHKATGMDDISNEHIKGSFLHLSHIWLLLFNLILSTGSIVSGWSESILCVLFKGKGDTEDTNGYRGIAWLSHCFKWLTKCIANRIYRLTVNTSIPDEQYGFLRGKSTIDAIKKLRSAVKNRKQSLYAVFIDFRKAFDSVPRNLLIYKLFHLHNIRGRILKLLLCIYSFNTVRVFDGIALGDPISQFVGVLQGDSLSPLVFILFIADIPSILSAIRNLYSVLYADDLVVYSESLECVQKAVDVLYFYFSQNGLSVNVAKTKVMKFRDGGRLKNNDVVYYGDTELAFCKEYEYLGIMLQTSWTFTRHLRLKRNKFLIALNSSRNLRDLSLDGAKRYFDTMLKPIVTYGLEAIWSDLKTHHFYCWTDVNLIFSSAYLVYTSRPGIG